MHYNRGIQPVMINRPLLRVGMIAACLVLLAGCSMVELNAPILDAAGINLKGRKADVNNVRQNAPLVLPPKMKKLPPPGDRSVTQLSQQWPNDPDLSKAQKLALACAKKREIQRNGQWDPKKGDIETFEQNLDPLSRSPGIYQQYINNKDDVCARAEAARRKAERAARAGR